MEKDLVKRFIKKDGSQRISFYREDYAENPRDMTDEPLHCEDWSRSYSIMNKHERETKSDNACKWIRYMLERYGNTKEIFKVLFENAKSDKHNDGDNALVYDKSRHEWILNYWIEPWKDYSGEIHGNCWSEEASFCCKIKDLTAWDIASYLSDEQIEVFADEKYFTDGIKIMSYSFGYYGEISFYHKFSTDSEGIAWLEKDEFLKYSGNDEEYWKNNDCYDIAKWLVDELEAWGNNEVYGFVIEDCIKSVIHKEYTNVDKEDEDYEEEEWEESDSCWGYYGELDKVEGWIFEEYGLNKEDFEEENV
jgi:hypothetical protein